MLRYVLCKLDTPCTLVESAWRVPTAEPVNFAKAIIEANPQETVDICMLGHAAKQIGYGDNGTIRTVPYFGDPKSVKDEFDGAQIIIWQGRHIFNVSMPSEPSQLGAKPTLVNPYSAGDYDRLCMVKMWQVMMYNLLSSSVIPENASKFFICTDLRLPLVELNKIDPVSVPKKLPSDIILLTQAYHADAYNAWQQKYFNGMPYPETDIVDYTYKFKKALYLPLHALPLISHEQFRKEFSAKHGTSIFQVQSIKYTDDYRKKKLGDALKFVDGYCTLHGRFRADERGIVVSNYPEYADRLLANVLDNSDRPSECFFDSAKVLADHKTSLIITDQRYARFGLCPNRFVEALAVGTVPLVVKDALKHCDTSIQSIMEALGIDATKTIIDDDGKTVIIRNANGEPISMTDLDVCMRKCCDALRKQLMTELNKFSISFF